jgi:hypothetical protein
LEPSKWKPFELSVGIVTVQRSLFGFDINRLPMRPAETYAMESRGRASLDMFR